MQEKIIYDDTILWDEILKAVAQTMPEQLFPLFKEVFGKSYPKGTPIRLLSTEQSTFTEASDAPPHSRFTDITLVVNGTDYYHLECQMRNDGLMVIRMVAYDLHVAIQHGTSHDQNSGEIIVKFPRSAVIYPEKNKNIPAYLKCRLIFHDGSEHIYQIPTVRIQSYSLQEILEKHLDLFIPYTLLRLRPRLKHKVPLTKKELTSFIQEVIVILQKEFENGFLTERQVKDYISLFRSAAAKVFVHHQTFRKEVYQMTKSLIDELPSVIEDRMLAEQAAKIASNEALIAKMQSEISEKASELSQKESELLQKNSELSQKNSELLQKDSELSQKNSELSQKNSEILRKDSEIARLKAELERLKQK